MNILYRCDEYPPMPYGGIGSVVKMVAENLAARGHNVYVIGYYHNARFSYENINNVQVYRFGKSSMRWFPSYWVACLLSRMTHTNDFSVKRRQRLFHRIMIRNIKRWNIDIVEYPDFQEALFRDVKCRLNYAPFPVPSVARIHGSASFLLENQYKPIPEFMQVDDKDNIARADAICAVSRFSARWVADFVHDGRDIDVIYNPIAASSFHSHDVYPSNTNLLYFGKFVRTKGIYSLLAAFRIVHQLHPEVTLTLIGRGDHIEQEGVVVKEFMPHYLLMQEIDQAYLTILPSYFETFSMAAVEVFARNCALMFTNRASGPELMEDGVNGWMVDPDNADEMAQKIIYAIEHPEVVQRMADCGYQRCLARFSTDVIIPQLEEYYTRLISDYQNNHSNHK